MRYGRLAVAAIGATVLAAYLGNASWLAPEPDQPYFISHRGVHQTFDPTGVGPQDCTATRIAPITHTFIENTLPAIGAAFDAGAEIVEIDIHPTTDNEFAVFHDWTLDCRTDGTGITREHSMAEIRSLDAGWGYTADDGATYPLRGTGIGLIPSLGEVLDAFPGRRFVINIKSNDPHEAERLAVYLDARNIDPERLIVVGAPAPLTRLAELRPGIRQLSRRGLKDCALRYLLTGWSGFVPQACRNTVLILPKNYARLAWGWPRRLEQRMADANTLVWVMGDLDRATMNSTGIDTLDALDALPDGYSGGIWTNRIERVNPSALGRQEVR
ncbi:glycerophosphodiester phosphodiesterase family protein [Maricaulis virginensis]|uniref:Glycerophosphoryl diester phosphodiesterase n=1 Tax=Maricaulis virginensis TaxID=144022 RepID=A0A9W6IKD9_9PROT|nr:glycerophosphodiester phosphodiesterase family protein [Maricaulis virginensis]GLK51548.1 glycerophosphoryl diester phosphodiesterase [Maricaulis virginensis]